MSYINRTIKFCDIQLCLPGRPHTYQVNSGSGTSDIAAVDVYVSADNRKRLLRRKCCESRAWNDLKGLEAILPRNRDRSWRSIEKSESTYWRRRETVLSTEVRVEPAAADHLHIVSGGNSYRAAHIQLRVWSEHDAGRIDEEQIGSLDLRADFAVNRGGATASNARENVLDIGWAGKSR